VSAQDRLLRAAVDLQRKATDLLIDEVVRLRAALRRARSETLEQAIARCLSVLDVEWAEGDHPTRATKACIDQLMALLASDDGDPNHRWGVMDTWQSSWCPLSPLTFEEAQRRAEEYNKREDIGMNRYRALPRGIG
jgi:hypothetical protein